MTEKLSNPLNDSQQVELVTPDEIDTVAQVLAEAYAEDPIHAWSMPKEDTRHNDAVTFFSFFLKRMQIHRWEVYATIDRSAVAVMATVLQKDTEYRESVRYMPQLIRTLSPASEYIRWIETFRPALDHRYLEFIGSLPSKQSHGKGSLLLRAIIEMSNKEKLPVWTWSSNSRNLTFYKRLGFQIDKKLSLDADPPPVTTLWRPIMPFDD